MILDAHSRRGSILLAAEGLIGDGDDNDDDIIDVSEKNVVNVIDDDYNNCYDD